MACGRRIQAKNRLYNSGALSRRGHKNIAAAGGNVKKCLVCGKKYNDMLDKMMLISFFNILYSTIFMRSKYNPNNLPKDKMVLFTRYCKQYSGLFVCSACENRIGEAHAKIYKAYRNYKNL